MYKAEAQKHRETKKNKTTKPKKGPKKNTFVHSGKPPLFLFFFLFLLSHVCKAVFCRKHYRNSAFSRTQLLGITDSKPPFGAPSQNGTFATKSAILDFPLCLLKPQFL